MRWCLAVLLATAAFAQEPEKVREKPKPLAQSVRPSRPFVVAPGQTITVKPDDAIAAAAPICSVPLTNVLPRAMPQLRMPTMRPSASRYPIHQVPLPAPPCEEPKP